jgi:ribosomal protein L32
VDRSKVNLYEIFLKVFYTNHFTSYNEWTILVSTVEETTYNSEEHIMRPAFTQNLSELLKCPSCGHIHSYNVDSVLNNPLTANIPSVLDVCDSCEEMIVVERTGGDWAKVMTVEESDQQEADDFQYDWDEESADWNND